MDQFWQPARSVFLSDLHLGWRYSRPEMALDYLNRFPPEFLYLVGDTFEWSERPGFELPKRPWNRHSDRFLMCLDRLGKRGTNITFLAGNHDNHLATCQEFANFKVQPHAVHETANGRRYLVVHGDIFDCHVERTLDWASRYSGQLYPLLMSVGSALIRWGWRPKTNHRHWATYWKLQFAKARKHIDQFEQFMIELASAHSCHGVICGHIHKPTYRRQKNQEYVNCGDWVEHQSLVVETRNGTVKLIRNLESTDERCCQMKKEEKTSDDHVPICANEQLFIASSTTGQVRDNCERNLGHVFVNLPRPFSEGLCKSLVQSGRRIVLHPDCRFQAIPHQRGVWERSVSSQATMARDMATSDCVITVAGCQTMNEALALRKPVLAVANPRDRVQQSHGSLISSRHWGWTAELSRLSPHFLQQFLLAVPILRCQLEGVPKYTHQVLESFVESPSFLSQSIN
jgi:UDP-2,3-diacylglucosamine pyrophosphatase LpxH